MEIIANYGSTLVIFASIVGFFMAWGIGANDVANAMGTSVGSKALTIKQAIMIAMVFEFLGAYLAGGQVTSTIRKGIINSSYFMHSPELLIYGMISALLAAGTWLVIASYYGWPVSTTHSIVGAIIGFSAVGVSIDSVHWGEVFGIIGSWIITPLIAGGLSYKIFMSSQKLIFNTDDPIANAKKYVPYYMFLSGFVLSLVTITKGLKHVGLHFSFLESAGIAFSIGLIVAFVGRAYINTIKIDMEADKTMHYANVEKIFAALMIVTACSMAFAHGSNDVANAIGPLAAVVNIVKDHGVISDNSQLIWWILPLGGLGIVLGLAFFGHRVMATIGSGITHLTPSRGFAAELSAAMTVVIASGTGLPISTTQTLVGAVLGVGMAHGIAALNLNVIRNIVISWVVTLPIGAGLSIIFFFMLKGFFG